MVKLIEDTNSDIYVKISGLIHQEGCKVNEGFASVNNQLETYCNNKNVLFVNNNNMKSSCLAKVKLHLNKTRNCIFARNIVNVLKKVWSSSKRAEQVNWASFVDASTTSPKYENINVTLKRVRHSNLNNVIFPYLNITSIRNKVGDLDKTADGNIHICV